MYSTVLFAFSCFPLSYCNSVFAYQNLVNMGGKCTDEKTIQAIIYFHKTGLSSKEICICKKLKFTLPQELIQNFKQAGSKSLSLPQKPFGRPSKVLERARTLLRRQLKVNSSLTAHQIKEENPNILAWVSLHTIHDILTHDLGYHSYRTRKKPLVNDSLRKNRIQFAKIYQD